MKHFIRSFIVSVLLTGLVGAAFVVFSKDTFFTPTINLITELCMLLILVAIWYLFAMDVWRSVKTKSLPAEQPKIDEQPRPILEVESDMAEQQKAEPEETGPIIVPDNEPVLFIPDPQPEPEASNQAKETTTAASNRRLTAAEKKQMKAQMNQERAAKRAEKLQQAAQQKQAQRARRQQEDAQRQQQKLEQLKAEAARKKANSSTKKNNWNSDSCQ